MTRTHTTPRSSDRKLREPERLHRAVAWGLIYLALLTIGGCGDIAKLTVADGTGPSPVLPAPTPMKIPTVEIADAVGWAAGEQPVPAAGLAVNAFASGLDHPRWLLVLANGDVLVAETNRPPNTGKDGIKAKIMGVLMKKAGAGVPSPDRITLLRDADGDGKAEIREVFASQLTSPFGMVELGDAIYVANTDGVVRFDYASGDLQARAKPTPITALPAGDLNHHWTKSLVASPDGQRLYAGVGSNSNVAEAGMAVEEGRAAIYEINPVSGAAQMYATGLRNPVGMDFEPVTGKLWVAVNERDALGSDLVPDYMTAVTEGGFYGWPWSYYGQHIDPRLEPVPQDKVASAIVPDYALGPHTASLGLAFYDAALIPSIGGAAIVGQHGSWNRQPPSGYRVIAVPFANGQPAGKPRNLLTGFLDDDGQARGRPVGVAVARDGAILVADDVGNAIWRITPAR